MTKIHNGGAGAWATSDKYIASLFLVSGFSALIYQVVWQRVLFTTFGINTEAVTVIVSVFMFGLGIGALLGGYLQKRYHGYLLQIFLALEVLIGCFGLVSLDLIHLIGGLSDKPSTLQLVLWAYAILAVPTLLMGATLPILVAYLQQYFDNLGKTVGLLYAFNTIGSGIAALVTVQVLFVLFGLTTAVKVAAMCNFATALLIFDASRRLRQAKRAGWQGDANETDGKEEPARAAQQPHLPYHMAFISLMLVGYISLSQEILWYRLLGYVTGGRPQVFGMLLAAFLTGIALGSLRAKTLCETGRDPYRYLVQAMLLAAAVFYLAIPAAAWLTGEFGKQVGPDFIYPIIALVAFFTGGVLPMLIHVGVAGQDRDSTQTMSWLYFANIIGATCGPMLTGFILLDHFTLEGNVVILTGITMAFVLMLLLVIPKPLPYKGVVAGIVLAMLGAGALLHGSLFDGILEKIQYADSNVVPFRYKLENRGGIIAVEPGAQGAIFGGGIYDGRFNTDPVVNSNYVDRAYMIAALHRKPQRILEIGLSSGSWNQAISSYRPATNIVVVEINPGYVEITRHYPHIAQALTLPQVTLYFDDGRRWLRHHEDEKFDAIVINNTFHWRSNSTNLLSKEFLDMMKRHLHPGGVVYYNTTESRDVVYTAAHVFAHVTMYRNFVAASDAPFDLSRDEKRANLLRFVLPDGSPLFERDAAHRAKLEELAGYQFKEMHDSILKEPHLQLVTDDNMAVEYKVKY